MKAARFHVYVYGLAWSGVVRYIGVARLMGRRFARHRRDANAGSALPVHRAFRAHGLPEMVVLAECVGYDEAYATEARLVAEYRASSAVRLLNVADGGRGGGGNRGRPLSEAHRQALSRANSGKGKGVPMPAETRQKISVTTTGRPGRKWTEGQRQKIVDALTGRKVGPMTSSAKARLRDSQRIAWTRRRMEGKTQSNTRLTRDQVIEIRSVYVRGSSEYGLAALGKRFGVSTSTIANVVSGRYWSQAA